MTKDEHMLFDAAYFNELCEALGHETALMIFEKMFFHLKEKCAALQDAFATREVKAIENVSHALASNAAQMGLYRLGKEARRLEHAAAIKTAEALPIVLVFEVAFFKMANESFVICDEFIKAQKQKHPS